MNIEFIPDSLKEIEENIKSVSTNSDIANNFYKNIETIKIEETGEELYDNGIGEYNTKTNTIRVKKGLSPEEKALTIYHELIHMSGTVVDENNEVVRTGFRDERLPEYYKYNRGLTEGFVEQETRKSKIVKNSSPKSINELMVGQLSQIISPSTISKSYYSAQGIELIKRELYDVTRSPKLIEPLLYNMELNDKMFKVATFTTTLNNVQTLMFECFKLKIKRVEETYYNRGEDGKAIINLLINDYEENLITPEVLERLGKDPHAFGIEETLNKFYQFKAKYSEIDKDNNIKTSKGRNVAAFSNMLLLSIITGIIAIGIIIFGVYLGM